MYDASNGSRFRLVCVLLGLLLAGPALAQGTCWEYTIKANSYVTKVVGTDPAFVCSEYFRKVNGSEKQFVGSTYSQPGKDFYCQVTVAGVGGPINRNGFAQAKEIGCPENPCAEKAGQEAGAGLMMFDVSQQYIDQWSVNYLDTGNKTATSCHQGCVASGVQQMAGCNGSGASKSCFMVIDKAKYSGAQCQSENKPADTPPAVAPDGGASAPSWSDSKPFTCDVGKCPGTVNGAQVCMKCDKLSTGSDSTSSTNSSSTSASGATSSDGSNTSSTSTTTCDETTGKCTTTTTTTKTNADGSSSSSTSTETESKGQYCVKNPWDTKQCGGKGTGSGDGTGDGEGDGEGEGEKCEDTDLLKCMRAGNASGDSSAVGTAGAAVNYTPNQLISLPTGCPAPKTFQYFGKSFSFDYDSLCVGAEKARPFVLLLAAAFASIIVVLGLRK